MLAYSAAQVEKQKASFPQSLRKASGLVQKRISATIREEVAPQKAGILEDKEADQAYVFPCALQILCIKKFVARIKTVVCRMRLLGCSFPRHKPRILKRSARRSEAISTQKCFLSWQKFALYKVCK